jgi:hypothetical protein
VKVIFDTPQPAAKLTAPHSGTDHNFNGDGKADILLQSDSSLPSIWTMDGAKVTGAALPNPGGPRGISLQRPISTATASPIFFSERRQWLALDLDDGRRHDH